MFINRIAITQLTSKYNDTLSQSIYFLSFFPFPVSAIDLNIRFHIVSVKTYIFLSLIKFVKREREIGL